MEYGKNSAFSPVYWRGCGPRRGGPSASQSSCRSTCAGLLRRCSCRGRGAEREREMWEKGIEKSWTVEHPMRYLWTNCTNPHCFPTGILTEAMSPHSENDCLRSSSLTFGSSPPTKTWSRRRSFAGRGRSEGDEAPIMGDDDVKGKGGERERERNSRWCWSSLRLSACPGIHRMRSLEREENWEKSRGKSLIRLRWSPNPNGPCQMNVASKE